MESDLRESKTHHGISVSAIISAASGVLTYLLLFFHSLINMRLELAVFLAPIPALAAIITGHKAKRQIRRSAGGLRGKKLANTGLTLGYIYILTGLILFLLVIVGLISGISGILGLFN